MSQREPDRILTVFDDFDLDVPEERRLALFALNDYFGTVFTDVGEQLDFRTSDYGASIKHQWDKASSRLRKIESVEIDDEYHEALYAIGELRGTYAHDFSDYPPIEPIESARHTAPDWADWIREAADEYEEFQETLTATEALIQVGQRSLEDRIEDRYGHPAPFTERAKSLNNQALELEESLVEFREDEEVTKGLVEVIADILDWERDKNQFVEEVEVWKEEEAQRRERMDRAENTYNFVVVDKSPEYDSIHVVKHHIGEPDDGYTFTISNCPISEEEMDYLRDLDVNDEVHLWIGSELYRNRGRVESEPIIKEVVDTSRDSVGSAAATDW